VVYKHSRSHLAHEETAGRVSGSGGGWGGSLAFFLRGRCWTVLQAGTSMLWRRGRSFRWRLILRRPRWSSARWPGAAVLSRDRVSYERDSQKMAKGGQGGTYQSGSNSPPGRYLERKVSKAPNSLWYYQNRDTERRSRTLTIEHSAFPLEVFQPRSRAYELRSQGTC
jgi:hypothetical protein